MQTDLTLPPDCNRIRGLSRYSQLPPCGHLAITDTPLEFLSEGFDDVRINDGSSNAIGTYNGNHTSKSDWKTTKVSQLWETLCSLVKSKPLVKEEECSSKNQENLADVGELV